MDPLVRIIVLESPEVQRWKLIAFLMADEAVG